MSTFQCSVWCLAALLTACADSAISREVVPKSHENQESASEQTEKVRSYLLGQYFNQSDNILLVCFEGDPHCDPGSIKVRFDQNFDGFVGTGSCIAGNCDYFLFARQNDFREPIFEVSGSEVEFHKRPDRPADIRITMLAEPSTAYEVTYSFAGKYRPVACFLLSRPSEGQRLGARKEIDCSTVDGQL